MSIPAMCPYFLTERDTQKKGKKLYCECGQLKLPDKEYRRGLVLKYCASPTLYKECILKKLMDEYYERKYEANLNE